MGQKVQKNEIDKGGGVGYGQAWNLHHNKFIFNLRPIEVAVEKKAIQLDWVTYGQSFPSSGKWYIIVFTLRLFFFFEK